MPFGGISADYQRGINGVGIHRCRVHHHRQRQQPIAGEYRVGMGGGSERTVGDLPTLVGMQQHSTLQETVMNGTDPMMTWW